MAIKKSDEQKNRAQATLEFTFSMVIAILLLMGMIQVMVWTGKDLAQRRQAHESVLTEDSHGTIQTRPTFFTTAPFFSSVASNIFGE